MLFHGDGLIEAHDPFGEMFGFPRLKKMVQNISGGERLVAECLTELRNFIGEDWKQADDITLVTLERTMSEVSQEQGHAPGDAIDKTWGKVRAPVTNNSTVAVI